MCLQVFLKVDEDCAEVTSEGKPFQTRGAATPKTRSVWNARRPVCDSTQIVVAYVSHRQLPTASLSPGILVPYYCGSRTQMERNTFWDAQPVPIMQQRCNMVVFLAVPYQSCCRVKHWLQTILEASRYSDVSATAPTRWRDERVKLADWRNDECCVSVAELQNNWIQSASTATRESSWICNCPDIFPDREQTLQAWQYLRRQKMDHLGRGVADGLKHTRVLPFWRHWCTRLLCSVEPMGVVRRAETISVCYQRKASRFSQQDQ